jgi:hypothetical protein
MAARGVSLSVAILRRWWVNYLTADLASAHNSDYLSNFGVNDVCIRLRFDVT